MKYIQDYINAARIQLQDKLEPFRYEDDTLVMALDIAFDEAYRIRPDMFVKEPDPNLIGAPLDTTVVPAPRGYQMSFVYYMCGWATLSDQEDTQDARAGVFLNKFVSQLSITAS